MRLTIHELFAVQREGIESTHLEKFNLYKENSIFDMPKGNKGKTSLNGI